MCTTTTGHIAKGEQVQHVMQLQTFAIDYAKQILVTNHLLHSGQLCASYLSQLARDKIATRLCEELCLQVTYLGSACNNLASQV